jgi:hypothetical protein
MIPDRRWLVAMTDKINIGAGTIAISHILSLPSG